MSMHKYRRILVPNTTCVKHSFSTKAKFEFSSKFSSVKQNFRFTFLSLPICFSNHSKPRYFASFRSAKSPQVQSLYDVLGVDRSAPQLEIKKRYFALAKKYHPDLHPNDAHTTAKFQAFCLLI